MTADLSVSFQAAATLVRHTLPQAKNLEWRCGPTGVLSITLADFLSINIFDHETAVEGAADYHTHWYDFRSIVIAGKMVHFRYASDPAQGVARIPVLGQRAGLDHKAIGVPFRAYLTEIAAEGFLPGDSYEITAPEIHRVVADPGTVTLVTRQYKTSPDGYSIFKRPGMARKGRVPRNLDGFVELALGKIDKALERY